MDQDGGMKGLGALSRDLVSQVSRRGSGQNLPVIPFDERRLPAAVVADVDVRLPRSAWSAWVPSDGSRRELRRRLTGDEVFALERRRAELLPALAPYVRPDQDDEIAGALAEMFSGYPSMRQQGEDVVGRVACVMDLLHKFPAWAIKRACAEIHRTGFKRTGREETWWIEKTWPPTDAEINEAVEAAMRLHRSALDSATALLAAPVETPPDPKEKLTRAQIEEMLGRTLSGEVRGTDDGGHATRVAADLAARKAARAAP